MLDGLCCIILSKCFLCDYQKLIQSRFGYLVTRSTKDVGLKRANTLGVFDMNGNVWEWCFTLSGSEWVHRSGAWIHDEVRMRISIEERSNPDRISRVLGLRLARMHF